MPDLQMRGASHRKGHTGEKGRLKQAAYRVGRRVGVRSLDSGDIREGRERGEGECSWLEVREERGEKGELRAPRGGATAAAEAASWRSRGVTFSGATLPGLSQR